ncbi:MAG: M23 family metallopeptidase [Robiginitomaculum sp.]|nr:M23 family metallopeptidase [Robiginitomaculum sp.]
MKQSIEEQESELITIEYTRILVNPSFECAGFFEQGGAIQCKTYPNAIVEIGGIKTKSDQDGFVMLGFDRDAPAQEKIVVKIGTNMAFGKSFKITPRKYTISRIDGLPPSQVSTFSEAQLVRIRASSARKKKGFASRQQTMWFKDGFEYPLKDFIKTSPFGAQRILNGVKKKPHYGVDIAAPVGTPIYAPADGVISLADDDLYFEGAMVLIDHGQGLISMYLHMNAIDVKPGQKVKRGDKIGEVGSRGRSTGPHLCWRLKWRNRNLDPELLTNWPTDD